jgi:toxin ParE1/3/4
MQIRSIFHYIAEDNKDAAIKMVDVIQSKARKLESSPYIGIELMQKDYPFLEPGYKRLVINPYFLYYRIDGQNVYVTHIVHMKRKQFMALIEGEFT